MKNILILAFIFFTHNLWAVCSAPISRTNNGTNSVLTSAKYNLDLNTVYNKVNNLPGDCITDSSVNGSKLVDGTVSEAKLTDGAVTTNKVADGSITAAKLAAAIENLVPVGTILPYGGAAAPSGYLICNGQSLSRVTYATLFSKIGTAFGSQDGNSFNVPDLRGRFLRMVDGGAAIDPDRATRTALKTGGAIGDNIGSLQSYETKSHFHFTVVDGQVTSGFAPSSSNYVASSDTNTYVLKSFSSSGGTVANAGKTSTSGGNETRPVNVNVNYIIKY